VLRAFELEGFHFPKNSWVSILTGESHRNPETFADPDAYRLERLLGRRPSGDEYVPFGIDEHQCITGSLVKRVGTLFVEELVSAFSWSVSQDGPRRHGHFHWEPSPDFAIELVPAAPVHGER
jgi:cytochrome P450